MRHARDPARPLACLNENFKQLIIETRMPVATAPGRPAPVNYAFARKVAANVKQGSWLELAESELGVLVSNGRDQRIRRPSVDNGYSRRMSNKVGFVLPARDASWRTRL